MTNWIPKKLNSIRHYFSVLRKSHVVIALLLMVVLVPSLIFRLLPETNYLSQNNFIEKHEDAPAETLIVMLHAFNMDSSKLNDVRNTIQSVPKFKNSDVYMPELPFNTFSLARPGKLTAELLHNIDIIWQKSVNKGSPYKNILFVGHSMGSLYIRKVYVAAKGETNDAPFEQEISDSLITLKAASLKTERPWADKVSKIILMAGMNRGWSVSHHMSPTRAIKMQLGVGAGYFLEAYMGRLPIIFSIRRGAPFITQLRLQWLALEQKSRKESRSMAKTVQLLGSIDDLVSPYDNIDLVTGKNFYYIDVPYSGHKNIIDMLSLDLRISTGEMSDKLQNECREEVNYKNVQLTRRCKLKDALNDNSLRAADTTLTDQVVLEDPDVTDVLFVIHGIRDEGFWTQKIARRVLKKVKDNKDNNTKRTFATETSSYGYFPMLSFLHPGARQEKVEWLMDRYTNAKAKYPNARFHYVGHSHGTYLLAKAMEDYDAVKFCQVVFAGSVVKRDYDWNQFVRKENSSDQPNECDLEANPANVEADHSRINKIINFVATEDWVVAFFPKALQSLQVQDLGSAGHDGFDDPAVIELSGYPYVKGGHSAAIEERMWDAVAEFILYEKLDAVPSDELSKDQNLWVKIPGYFPFIIWILIIAFLVFIARKIMALNVSEWLRTVYVIGYFGLILTVLSSF